MHSSQLPVTEWWDPADDVYSVPPCPQGSGYGDADTWTEAFLFAAMIRWIWSDYDGYWGRWTRQLTTGDDVTPTQCACYYAGSTWHEGPMVREYHLEQNPDCPLHWAPSWLPPCTCHYGLHTAQLPYQVDRTRVRRRLVVLGSYFTIDPWCPHHAPVRAGGWEAFPDRPADDVLDEDERRGH